MRRSTSLFALAGAAALVVATVGRAGAQVSPSSSNKASATLTAEGSTPCPVTAVGAYTTDQFTGCSQTHSTTPVGVYTAAATADAVAGVSVFTKAEYSGSPGAIPGAVNAFGIYYRYISFGPSVVSLVFTSAVSHGFLDDAGAFRTFDAHIDVGFLDPDNAFGDLLDTFSYSGGSSVSGTVLVADLLGATSFYYDVSAHSGIGVAEADPFAFDSMEILDPSIVCFDAFGAPTDCHLSFTPPPVTGTPEPASLALMGTGLVGLAGFARRKRAANAA